MGGTKGNKNAKGNKGGRPTKLTSTFIEVATEVLSDGAVMLFSEREILEEINDKLDPKDQICQSTFDKWKAKYLAKESEEIEPIGAEFLHLLKKAVRYQKRMLMNAMVVDNKAWHRWAWIIERKYDEWNIKRKVEASGDGITKTIILKTITNDNSETTEDAEVISKLGGYTISEAKKDI